MEENSGKDARGVLVTPAVGGFVDLPEPYVNDAGAIQNIATEPCGVAVIQCRAGSRRSSHYHRTDWHKLYVVHGLMLYRERPVGGGAELYYEVRPGGCIYTPPMREHLTEFPVDTILVSFSALGRDHYTHEADLVRVEW